MDIVTKIPIGEVIFPIIAILGALFFVFRILDDMGFDCAVAFLVLAIAVIVIGIGVIINNRLNYKNFVEECPVCAQRGEHKYDDNEIIKYVLSEEYPIIQYEKRRIYNGTSENRSQHFGDIFPGTTTHYTDGYYVVYEKNGLGVEEEIKTYTVILRYDETPRIEVYFKYLNYRTCSDCGFIKYDAKETHRVLYVLPE